ncbi:MAG: ABC transporter ATP-binding protein [Fibrella sp.]|nr:ABC transporter ATP-binding protein [Armatimonadota bacterium]
MSLPAPLLVAENISVRHRKNDSPAVENVSLIVSPGDCVAIVGPNGAGKSTLLRALAGLSTGFVSGQIRMGGNALSHLSARELARCRAFVPQDNPMPFAFSVREAVSLGVADGAALNTIDAALSRFDLLPFAHRSVLALSGGERQRVALARAFAQDASLLILDEPTAHQDLRYAGWVLAQAREFVNENRKERAAVAVLHDLNLASRWADTVLLLKNGQTYSYGFPEQVLSEQVLSGAYETSVSTTPFIHTK